MNKLVFTILLASLANTLYGGPLISGPRIVRGIVNKKTYPHKTTSWSTTYEPNHGVTTITFNPAFDKQPVFTAIAVGAPSSRVQVLSVKKDSVDLNHIVGSEKYDQDLHFIAIESE